MALSNFLCGIAAYQSVVTVISDSHLKIHSSLLLLCGYAVAYDHRGGAAGAAQRYYYCVLRLTTSTGHFDLR